MSVDLDTRLHGASASLHRAVDVLPEGTPPVSGPSRRPVLLAAAAALIVLAIATVALALRDGNEDGVSTDPEVVPRLVLGTPPADMPATGATDLPVGENDIVAAPASFRLFDTVLPGTPGNRTTRVGVMVLHGGSAGPNAGDGSVPVTVRDRQGQFVTDELTGLWLTWQEGDDLGIVLGGGTELGEDQLLAMANGGTVSGESFTVGPVAAGLAAPTLVAEVDDADLWSGSPISRSAVGHMVGYQSETTSGRSVMIVSFAGSEDELAVLRWMHSAVTPVDVRGHDGWLGTQTTVGGESSASASDDGDLPSEVRSDPAVTQTVVWEEAPGVNVLVRSTGPDGDRLVTEEGVLELAESLRTADDAEWEALLDLADSPTPADAPVGVEGDAGDLSWSVYMDDRGQLCAATQMASDGVETCGEPVAADVLQDDAGNPIIVYGVIPDGATEVATDSGIGASVAVAEDGTQVYALQLDQGLVPVEMVFLDDAGGEVARAPVGIGALVADAIGSDPLDGP